MSDQSKSPLLFNGSGDYIFSESKTLGTNSSTPADPSSLFERAKADPKIKIESLDPGPERHVTVLAGALRALLYNETLRPDGDGLFATYPSVVVRERPASQIGKPDNASTWKIVGIYRHVQFLGGCTLEFVEKDQRLERENEDKAALVMRTTGPLRTFAYADDEVINEGDYIRCAERRTK